MPEVDHDPLRVVQPRDAVRRTEALAPEREVSKYSAAERKELPLQVIDAAGAVTCLVAEGLEKTQLRFSSSG